MARIDDLLHVMVDAGSDHNDGPTLGRGSAGRARRTDHPGYTVDGTAAAPHGERKCAAQYRIKPGPTALVADAVDENGASRIQFMLTGEAFGKRVVGRDTDPVIWMRLVVLGLKYREAYGVDARVTDPDLEITDRGDAHPTPTT
ncbi:hypothetical protein [Mycolicibacterium mageritense]|uniref:hypothetical protein n=1 Tax=Mycolicibacterium mageritense TaxID=53462 RepID=UPI001E3CC600|nr:hypothetical protein [Mycolicibacterium mageritense]MCC9181561.1 hypothetical protein [Mycolicibacterium mageritense]